MCAFVSSVPSYFQKASRSLCCGGRPRHFVNQHPRRRRAVVQCSAEQEPTPDNIRALITAETKAEQQRGLILVRQLPPDMALELLLLSVRTSKNEFIQATAAVALGELDLSDPRRRATVVATLAELLATAGDYGVRAAAAAGMGYVTDSTDDACTAMVEALIRALLEDGEWQVQFSCLASLGTLRDSRAVPTLVSWLRHDNDLLVQAAVGALGDIADASTIPNLLALLGATDMMTRQRLAQTLGRIPACATEPAAIDALRTLSKDQSFVVREAAKDALQSFGVVDAIKVDTLSDEELLDVEVANLLEGDEAGNAGGSASDALRRRLERSFSKEWTEDHSSASVLGNTTFTRETDKRDATPSMEDQVEQNAYQSDVISTDMVTYKALVEDLKYGEPKEQVLAAIALRRFDGRLASAAVQEAHAMDVNTSPQRLRSVCVALLGRGQAIAALIEVLRNDPEQNVRSAVCDALTVAGGGADAINACIDVLESDEHWLVRISAAIALGSIGKGNDKVEQALIKCLEPGGVRDLAQPQSSVVRRHAITALGFLGTKAAVGSFKDLLGDQDIETAVRYRVAAALSGIECDQSVALARALIEDEDASVAEMAQNSLDILAKRGFT